MKPLSDIAYSLRVIKEAHPKELEEIINFLKYKSGYNAPLLTRNPNGNYDPLQLAMAEGGRQMFLILHNLYNLSDDEFKSLVTLTKEQKTKNE